MVSEMIRASSLTRIRIQWLMMLELATTQHIYHHIHDEHIGSHRKKSHQFSERIAYQLHWNWLHASGIPRSLGWMTMSCLWVTDCSVLFCKSQCDKTSPQWRNPLLEPQGKDCGSSVPWHSLMKAWTKSSCSPSNSFQGCLLGLKGI